MVFGPLGLEPSPKRRCERCSREVAAQSRNRCCQCGEAGLWYCAQHRRPQWQCVQCYRMCPPELDTPVADPESCGGSRDLDPAAPEFRPNRWCHGLRAAAKEFVPGSPVPCEFPQAVPGREPSPEVEGTFRRWEVDCEEPADLLGVEPAASSKPEVCAEAPPVAWQHCVAPWDRGPPCPQTRADPTVLTSWTFGPPRGNGPAVESSSPAESAATETSANDGRPRRPRGGRRGRSERKVEQRQWRRGIDGFREPSGGARVGSAAGVTSESAGIGRARDRSRTADRNYPEDGARPGEADQPRRARISCPEQLWSVQAMCKVRREVARAELGKQSLCLQFAHGKCRLGAKCDHSHDPVSAADVILRWKHGGPDYNPKRICLAHAFAETGCEAGVDCPLSHDDEGTRELREDRNQCRGVRVCFKFINNKCLEGDLCILSHDPDKLAEAAEDLCFAYIRGDCRNKECRRWHPAGLPDGRRFRTTDARLVLLKRTCMDWLRGRCLMGEQCNFLHNTEFAKRTVCLEYLSTGQCGNLGCTRWHYTGPKAGEMLKAMGGSAAAIRWQCRAWPQSESSEPQPSQRKREPASEATQSFEGSEGPWWTREPGNAPENDGTGQWHGVAGSRSVECQQRSEEERAAMGSPPTRGAPPEVLESRSARVPLPLTAPPSAAGAKIWTRPSHAEVVATGVTEIDPGAGLPPGIPALPLAGTRSESSAGDGTAGTAHEAIAFESEADDDVDVESMAPGEVDESPGPAGRARTEPRVLESQPPEDRESAAPAAPADSAAPPSGTEQGTLEPHLGERAAAAAPQSDWPTSSSGRIGPEADRAAGGGRARDPVLSRERQGPVEGRRARSVGYAGFDVIPPGPIASPPQPATDWSPEERLLRATWRRVTAGMREPPRSVFLSGLASEPLWRLGHHSNEIGAMELAGPPVWAVRYPGTNSAYPPPDAGEVHLTTFHAAADMSQEMLRFVLGDWLYRGVARVTIYPPRTQVSVERLLRRGEDSLARELFEVRVGFRHHTQLRSDGAGYQLSNDQGSICKVEWWTPEFCDFGTDVLILESQEFLRGLIPRPQRWANIVAQ